MRHLGFSGIAATLAGRILDTLVGRTRDISKRNASAAVAAIFSLCLGGALAGAETYLLREEPLSGASARVQVEVRGQLRVHHTPAGQKQQQVKELPLAVDGELTFRQRLLPDHQGRRRAVRHYSDTQAKVVVDGRLFRPEIQQDRRLVQVEVEGEQTRLRCPEGPLTRQELDVVDLQGDSLLLHRLLPDREVQVGESWAVEGSSAAPIFNLDEAFGGGIQATLEAVEQDVAKIQLEGVLDGAVEGVGTRIEFEAELQFDLAARHITMFDVTFVEKRDISGGQPGIDARSHLRTTIEKAGIPASLRDEAVSQFPPQSGAELIRYRSPNGRFALIHAPAWRVISDTPKRTTLRLLDGGDVIAQGTLSMLTKLPADKPLTLKTFEADVRATLGNLKGEVVQSEQSKLDSGLHLLRVTGAGQVQEVDVQWVYLHASDPQGHRVSCVFTLEQKRVERFQGAEISLLSGLEFITATAQKSAETK